MSDQGIKVTIVNHVGVDIACEPAAVWQAILEEYIEARKFKEIGYQLEPLDDPAAFRGGYRMRFEQDGQIVDDRICHVTEFDETARRLSLWADYLTVPGGMNVFATYEAAQTPTGARFTIDCHTRMNVTPAEGADVKSAVDALMPQFDGALINYLESVKARLERGEGQ